MGVALRHNRWGQANQHQGSHHRLFLSLFRSSLTLIRASQSPLGCGFWADRPRLRHSWRNLQGSSSFMSVCKRRGDNQWQTHLHPSFQAPSPAPTGSKRNVGAGKGARSPEIRISAWHNISPWQSSFTHISKNYLYGLDAKGSCWIHLEIKKLGPQCYSTFLEVFSVLTQVAGSQQEHTLSFLLYLFWYCFYHGLSHTAPVCWTYP